MKRLIRNEWLKLRYDRTSLVCAIVGIAFNAFAAFLQVGEMQVWDYGLLSGMEYLKQAGSIAQLLMIGITVGIFSQEFKNRTIHNALSCGVSRKEYFIAKAYVYFVACFAIHLISIILFTVIRGIIYGWFPPNYSYPNLVMATIVFHLGEAFVAFAWMSMFLFVAMLFRNSAANVCVGFAVWYGEAWMENAGGVYGDPLHAIQVMRNFLRDKQVLSVEFMVQVLPCLAVGIIFLFLAYLVFKKRDIN